MRTILIGDVHGCLEELARLLEKLSLERADHLVFLGDLIHKGPDSAGVVKLGVHLRDSGYRTTLIRGNHESVFLKRVAKAQKASFPQHSSTKSGRETPDFDKSKHPSSGELLRSLSPEEIAFLQSSVPVLVMPELGAIAVHAGIPMRMDALPQEGLRGKGLRRLLRRVTTTRYERTGPDQKAIPVRMGHEEEGDWYWAQRYDGRFGHVFYGHHPYLTGRPVGWPFATGLDLGCVVGGALAAAVLTPTHREFVVVEAAKAYCEPSNQEGWADNRLGTLTSSAYGVPRLLPVRN